MAPKDYNSEVDFRRNNSSRKYDSLQTDISSESDIMDLNTKHEYKWYFFRKEWEIKWDMVFITAAAHIFVIYALLTFPYIQNYKTTLWGKLK